MCKILYHLWNMYKKQCNFWNNKYLFNFWTVASHSLKQIQKIEKQTYFLVILDGKIFTSKIIFNKNIILKSRFVPRTYILKTRHLINSSWTKVVSRFLISQCHPRLSDLTGHSKATGSTETTITISWLAGKSYQATRLPRWSPRLQEVVQDGSGLNIHYFKSLYQSYSDHQTRKCHLLPSPSKAYQKAHIK